MVAEASGPALRADDALADDAIAQPEGFATCPKCHAVDTTMTAATVAGGGDWRCRRCAQLWDQSRIATVAAYDAWESARRLHAGQGA